METEVSGVKNSFSSTLVVEDSSSDSMLSSSVLTDGYPLSKDSFQKPYQHCTQSKIENKAKTTYSHDSIFHMGQ